ncbi:MAG: hypothetical protein M1536_09130 [Firmicutes bacterium]|nr:hypothetical protein [Bacillota bacterium]
MISRKTKIILLSLLLLYFVLNLFFVCRYYNKETLFNCYSIEQFRDARNDYAENICIGTRIVLSYSPLDFKMPIVDNFMARPLNGPFYYFIASVLKSFGYSGSLIFPLQMVNLIFSCLALLFIFLSLFKLSNNLTASLIGVLLVAFSFCFWYWGTSVKSYPITTAFLFLSIYLLLFSRWHLTLLSGIFMALAAGFTFTAVIIMPVAITFFFLQKLPAFKKLFHCMIFLVVSFFLIFLIHSLSYWMYFKMENFSFALSHSSKMLTWTGYNASSTLDIKRLQEASADGKIQILRTQMERLWRRFSEMSILPIFAKGDRLYSFAPLQEVVKFVFKSAGVIFAVIIILSIFFIKGWKQNFFFCLPAFFWVSIPLLIFFIADADNDYTYIAAFGLIFFITAASSFSRILRVALILWISLIAFVNILVVYPVSREDTNQMLMESKRVAEKIKTGTQFAYFDPNFSQRGEDIYLAYYSRAKMRIILPYMENKFPLNSNEIVVNQSELEHYPCVPEEVKKSFVDFLRKSGYKETDNFFLGENTFAVYKKK